jgi:MoaA/NifB/PqqE/SkfB family radical SAM enzyme
MMSLGERLILARKVARISYARRLYRKSPLLRNPLRLYRLLSANPLKPTHPVALQVEITSRCNLSCRYCIHHKMAENDKQIGDMPFERFVDILDRHQSTLQLLHIQGQGEPFLHPRFADMIAESKKRQLTLLAFSNGTLWTASIAR